MKNLLYALAMIALWAAPSNACELSSERDEIKKQFARLDPSVAALYSLSEGGDIKFLCTATAVDHEEDALVLLTAFHCVRRGVSYLVSFGDNQFHSVRVWQIPGYEISSKDHPRAYGQPKTDIALFLLDDPVDVPTVTMADSSIIEIGSSLVSVGFPLGLAKIGYEGSVAGYFNRSGSDEDGYIMLQIFGAPGSSGSAVVDVASGEIIGVLVQGRQARAGLPVILATPIDYLKYLVPVPTGDVVSAEKTIEEIVEGAAEGGIPEQ